MRVKTILMFCFIYILCNLFLLTEYPTIGGDEAGYAYSALAFKDTLQLQSPGIYYSNLGIENRALPPLYMLLLGGWFLFFGFGLYQARLLSILVGTSMIFLLIYYAPRLINKEGKDKEKIARYKDRIQTIVALLLFFNPFFLSITRLSSQTSIALFFTVLSILSLFISFQKKKAKKYIAAFVSGIFIVFGIFSHQYAFFIFIAMLITLFLYEKKEKAALLFSFALIPCLFLLSYGLFLSGANPYLINYYLEARTTISFSDMAYSFLQEPMRFIYWPSALFTFLFFIVLVLTDLFLYKKKAIFFEQKYLSLLLFFIFILFAFFEKKKAAHYFIYYYPILMIYTSIALSKLFDKKKAFARLLLIFYLISSMLLITHKIYTASDRDFSAFCEELLPLLPPHGKIIVDAPASLCLKDKEAIFLITETTMYHIDDVVPLFREQNVTAAVFVNISTNESTYGTDPSLMPQYQKLIKSIREHCTEKASIKEQFYGHLFQQRRVLSSLVVYNCSFIVEDTIIE